MESKTGTPFSQSLDLQLFKNVFFPVPNMHFPELFSNNGKKKKKSKSAFQPLKNPCLALNELRPGLEYKLLEQTGPVHMPTFKIAIDLDGQIFTGEGRYGNRQKK